MKLSRRQRRSVGFSRRLDTDYEATRGRIRRKRGPGNSATLFINRGIVMPAHFERDGQHAKARIDSLLPGLVDEMNSIRNDKFSGSSPKPTNVVINEHAAYEITELDRTHGRPIRKVAVRRWRIGKQVAVNMHTIGTVESSLER